LWDTTGRFFPSFLDITTKQYQGVWRIFFRCIPHCGNFSSIMSHIAGVFFRCILDSKIIFFIESHHTEGSVPL
jgi:heptaprenylglyceryl phosphate synthase